MWYLILTLLHLLVEFTLAKATPEPGKLTLITDPIVHSTTNKTRRAEFYIYVPLQLARVPALVTAVHYCTGSGPRYFQGSPYKGLADKHGFIVVYPSSPHDGGCWDVSSENTLRHGKGGDSGDIIDMVSWTLGRYKQIDKRKVFVVGESSGAMMTVSIFCSPFIIANEYRQD
jgi:acetylxylan esterase